MTVKSGVRFVLRGKDKSNGLKSIRTSQTKINFGVAYAVSKDFTLEFKIEADITKAGTARSGVTILYN